MKLPTLRRGLPTALACAVLPALLPSIASASTWTVDDDQAQCPSASFASIQSAVDQAAPHDTILVCDGLYLEGSTPINSVNSPSQTGSMNGLTITKPLTIKGAGSTKVTIRPKASLGATLAGTAPYLRDGGGNVVTISRQSLGSTDADENFVDISGVTIDSPTTYAEAGVAFFNTSGRIANSRIGPLLRAADANELSARPHGWGVIQTNHLQGAEAGARRSVTVTGSLISGYQTGGVLFDESRGTDGSSTTSQRSGMVGYGMVADSRVVGTASTLIPQTGVRYANGARGSVTGTEITGNYFASDRRQSVGLLLTDAETGLDPSNPAVRAFFARSNRLNGNGYGAFNANATNDAVRTGAPALIGSTVAGEETWFGCAAGPVAGSPSASTTACQGVSGNDGNGAPSVETGTPRATAQTITAPAAVVDQAPTAAFATGDYDVAPGQKIDPVVLAGDDFGVRRVVVALDGTAIAGLDRAPYEFAPTWTPSSEDVGRTFSLTAVVTDSAGQTTTSAARQVRVVGPGFTALSSGTGTWDAGSIALGSSATREQTFTNVSAKSIRLRTIDVTGAGFARSGGTCAPGLALAPSATCTVGLTFTPALTGPAAGRLSVVSSASGTPVVVELAGTGVDPSARGAGLGSTPGRTPGSGTSPSGSAPTATTPSVTRRRVKAFTVKTSPVRDRRFPLTFRTSGRISRPAGVTAAQGCGSDAFVAVQVKRGSRTLSNQRVKLSSACTFSSRVTFRSRSTVGRSTKLTIRATFSGNKYLLPSTSKATAVRIR